MSVFDFGAAASGDAYHPPTYNILPEGNYVATVAELDNATSSGGYPMLRVVLENDQGRQWDNIVISPNEFSVQKLLGFIDSAGLARPDIQKAEMSPQDGRLSDAYANQLVGKSVGLIVRDEEDYRPDHVGEVRPRVKGYVSPSILKEATTGPLGGQATNGPAQTQGAQAEPLAF